MFFSHFLFGRHFVVITDHKALVSFLHSRVLNRRLHGWMLQFLEYDFTIQYRPGNMNQDADALSRQAWDSSEGDLWRPAALEAEESKELRAKELRTASEISQVGGDVGTDKTAHMRKEKERKEKDVVGQAHPEVDSGRKELDKGIVA